MSVGFAACPPRAFRALPLKLTGHRHAPLAARASRLHHLPIGPEGPEHLHHGRMPGLNQHICVSARHRVRPSAGPMTSSGWRPSSPRHRWDYWVARSSRATTHEGRQQETAYTSSESALTQCIWGRPCGRPARRTRGSAGGHRARLCAMHEWINDRNQLQAIRIETSSRGSRWTPKFDRCVFR